jgi:hypothetical protein
MTDTEAPFAVEASLRRHFERERDSQLGFTLRALLRSDASRLQFWDGSLTIANEHVESKCIAGNEERVAIEAARRDPTLTACVGYVLIDSQQRPEPGAWLIQEGNIVDPARGLREAAAFLGLALRATERELWTPTHPHAIAERDVARLAV